MAQTLLRLCHPSRRLGLPPSYLNTMAAVSINCTSFVRDNFAGGSYYNTKRCAASISANLPSMKAQASQASANLRALRSIPAPALCLGLGGLIPFAAAPIAMYAFGAYTPAYLALQAKYGAIILSFIGGTRWGSALEASKVQPDWNNLTYSVLLSLGACSTLLLPPGWERTASMLLTSGFIAAAYFDVTFPGYPPWFKGLRLLLSTVVVISLLTATCLSLMLPLANSDVKVELVNT